MRIREKLADTQERKQEARHAKHRECLWRWKFSLISPVMKVEGWKWVCWSLSPLLVFLIREKHLPVMMQTPQKVLAETQKWSIRKERGRLEIVHCGEKKTAACKPTKRESCSKVCYIWNKTPEKLPYTRVDENIIMWRSKWARSPRVE